MKNFYKHLRKEEGAMAVEFAIVSLLFLSFMLGIIEVGRIFWTWNALQYAVEETARYATVHTTATNADLVDYATTKMAGVEPNTTGLVITPTRPVISGITFIKISGTYTFSTLLPDLLPDLQTISLTAESKVPLVN
jgi:Flp pilus assembly protein TadG